MLSNRAGATLNRCLESVQRLWPTACVLCGGAVERTPARTSRIARVCSGCEEDLPLLPPARCTVCALPLPTGSVCGACLGAPPAYDSVCAPYAYAFPVDALIHRYKYGGDLGLAAPLASGIRASVGEAADVLIPMPLTDARQRSRGFNQAHELARVLSRRLGVPLLPHAVRRVKDTAPQVALPWKERARNVRGAFVCDVDLTGRHAAIVDDVMTTGATVNELARNLRRCGAARVSVWVVARTLKARIEDPGFRI